MPTEIAILNFTGFHANWGCQATSWELLKYVTQCFSQVPKISLIPQLPNSELDIALSESLDEIYFAVDSVLEGSPQADAQLSFLERLCVERYGFWADYVRSADFVLFQGEGTMSGIPDFHHGIGLLLLPFVAKHAWRKPLFAINQTIFGRDPRLLARVASIFNSFDFTAVREPASYQFAQTLGIDASHYIPDTAFLTRPFADSRLPGLSPSKRYFCLTGSALSKSGVDKFIFECADCLRSQTGLTPILVAAKDKKLRTLASNHWPSGAYERVDPDVCYPAVAHVLKHSEFMIGGRYHMAIMAAAVGTPTILLRGNTFKNEGLAAAIRAQLPLRDIGNAEDVLSDAHDLIANIGRVRSELHAAVASIHNELSVGQAVLSDHFAGGYRGAPLRAPHVDVTPALVDYYADAALTKEDLVRNKARKRSRMTAEEQLGRRPTWQEIQGFLLAAHAGDVISTQTISRNIVTCAS